MQTINGFREVLISTFDELHKDGDYKSDGKMDLPVVNTYAT